MEKLSKETAIEKVEAIKAFASDDETAHGLEADLRNLFIECVASGAYEIDEAIEIAKIVESTSNIEFSRWFA